MKVPYTAAHGAVRFSLSRETTAAEIDRVAEALPGIINTLRLPPLAVQPRLGRMAVRGGAA
jgi:cysteine sulfinate desulfinase/cysteine desulfurase-like protein